LYANTFETIEELDKAITDFSTKLSSYNPEALLEMKKYFGKERNTGTLFCYNAPLFREVSSI
jgi:hypothetical protein